MKLITNLEKKIYKIFTWQSLVGIFFFFLIFNYFSTSIFYKVVDIVNDNADTIDTTITIFNLLLVVFSGIALLIKMIAWICKKFLGYPDDQVSDEEHRRDGERNQLLPHRTLRGESIVTTGTWV